MCGRGALPRCGFGARAGAGLGLAVRSAVSSLPSGEGPPRRDAIAPQACLSPAKAGLAVATCTCIFPLRYTQLAMQTTRAEAFRCITTTATGRPLVVHDSISIGVAVIPPGARRLWAARWGRWLRWLRWPAAGRAPRPRSRRRGARRHRWQGDFPCARPGSPARVLH